MSAPRIIRQDGPYFYTYSPHHKPIARVAPGETVVIHTVDAFNNKLQSTSDLPSDKCQAPFVNPQTGPIYIEGAQFGDTLIVHLHEITPDRDFAVTALVPHFGALTSTHQTATLQPPLPEQTRIMPLRDGLVHFNDRIALPYKPFLGTLGVAPQIEAISALVPGAWGGNMDCVDTCPGNSVLLPVNVEGALFFTGDAHATQGDGEVTGVAAEMPARVTLSFELRKNSAISWPRIISPDFIMATGSARPLEDAARIALRELIAWMVADYGFEELEAYHLLGQVGRMRVGNMVDPNYTMVAKIARKYVENVNG